jgi:carbonic anhydrase/acetyltransferase-like protein (isoleucine patch superfamily)
VGAGALVTEGKVFPDGALIMGTPARVVRQLDPGELARFKLSAAHYVENARRFRAGLRPL